MYNPKEFLGKCIEFFNIEGNHRKRNSFQKRKKKSQDLTSEACIDANYVGSMVDKRSTSSYCTLLQSNLMTARNKKQNVVARSRVEAEYRFMH